MPILKLEITNPQALELIRKIKTKEIFIPILIWLKKYKWLLVSVSVIIVLIIAMVIGKKLSERTPLQQYTPPDIESPIPTKIETAKSDFSELKENIQNINTELPDPFVPVFDNAINLEETAI